MTFAHGGGIDGPTLARQVAARLSHPLTRFAPAPTGFLHLGHVVNALFVWGLARALDGRVLLRIEDHDRQRCRPEFESALLEDLEWLGFEPDINRAEDFRGRNPTGRQSDRDAIYRAAIRPLIDRGLIYGCTCSRAATSSQASGVTDQASGGRDQARIADDGSTFQHRELRYPGTCRDRGLPLEDGVGWRIRVESRDEPFEDALLGRLAQNPDRQCGDFLVRDRRGNWTYQWVATTDDTVQQIDVVIRGRDLLPSTGRQIYLARLLGRATPPVYVHHPLIMKSATQKLSKSDRDTGIRERRDEGWTAGRVIAEAARLAGFRVPGPTLAARDVVNLFQ